MQSYKTNQGLGTNVHKISSVRRIECIRCLKKHFSHLGRNNNYYFQYENRLISGVLEPVLRHTENICQASYYIQFSTNTKIYNHKIKTSIFSPCLRHLGALYQRKAVYNTIREITIMILYLIIKESTFQNQYFIRMIVPSLRFESS